MKNKLYTTHMSITTERLKLVPLSLKYAQVMFNEFTDEITIFMYPKAPKTIDDTIVQINSRIEKAKSRKGLTMVILRKGSDEFLGRAAIHQMDTDTPAIGIWIKKSAHGNKYGREAVTALRDWAEANLEYRYLRYAVDKRNIPSRKIAESLDGVIGKEFTKKNLAGKILDEVEYWIYKKN